MAVIEPSKAIGMFSEYYEDVEALEKKKYIEGADSASKINKKIRSLIELSFDNASDKLDNYNIPTLYAVTSGKYNKTVEKNAQEHYENQLELMKSKLAEYTEELRKINEMQENLKDVSGISEKIKEAAFEAKQQSKQVFEAKQQSVEVESKPSNEITEKIDNKLDKQPKSNKDTASKIQELKEQLQQLTEEFSKMNNQVSSQKQVSNQEEELWYEEVMRKTEDSVNSYARNARVEAKRNYSNIKIIKMEILDM